MAGSTDPTGTTDAKRIAYFYRLGIYGEPGTSKAMRAARQALDLVVAAGGSGDTTPEADDGPRDTTEDTNDG